MEWEVDWGEMFGGVYTDWRCGQWDNGRNEGTKQWVRMEKGTTIKPSTSDDKESKTD
jgi:hypothetical protein